MSLTGCLFFLRSVAKQLFFSYQLAQQLQTSLATCWPSYTKNSNNQKNWDHEYNKHGACTLEIYKTPFSYFYRACNLWHKYKVDKWLGNANICTCILVNWSPHIYRVKCITFMAGNYAIYIFTLSICSCWVGDLCCHLSKKRVKILQNKPKIEMMCNFKK